MRGGTGTVVVTSRVGELPPVERRGVVVVDADTFLAGGPEVTVAGATVINLCRSWRYLSRGYYVSLLAEARGQHVVPSVEDIEAFLDPNARFRILHEGGVDVIDTDEARARLRTGGEEGGVGGVPSIREWRQTDIVFRAPEASEILEVVVVLGRCDTPGATRLASRVYRAWPFPILEVRAVREDGRWRVFAVHPRSLSRVDARVRQRLVDSLSARKRRKGEAAPARPRSVAVLYEPSDPFAASTPETVERLERVFRRRGLRLSTLRTGDLDRLGDHDGLLIRTLTGLDQPAWRFALRAQALDMPVIDSPQDIVRCSNKVFLYELLRRAGLAMPSSVVVAPGALFEEVAGALGLPFVVKLPDGSFSTAVHRIDAEQDWEARVPDMLRRSPLLVAQAFVRTEYDWRITVLDGRPLFACRYHMVPGHWQIRRATGPSVRYGRVEAIPRDRAPADVVELACRAASLIGEGLYGVDLKAGPEGAVVIEVNDNPNLDTGYDDAADGDRIYEDLATWFEKRLPTTHPNPRPAPRPRRRPEGDLAALREPVGRVPRQVGPYDAWQVMGLELEYAVVDRDLNAVSRVEELISTLAGHPASDADMGLLGFSNEIFDHVFEIKNAVPLRSPARLEEVLVEGVRRASAVLAQRGRERLLPGGMHPWLRPASAKLWTRSHRTIYGTYSRLFDVHTHGWANVQAVHVNLPTGRSDEAVALMNAARLLVPYLPSLAASSPMFDGELQPAVDNRLVWILEHQARLPESCGQLVPEPLASMAQYRREVLGGMYAAVDRLPEAGALRHEFLNARAAVFKLSRNSLEIRVLDVQECPRMDVALAVFTRRALRALVGLASRLAPAPQEDLVADLRAVVRDGSRARVRAPFAGLDEHRDAEGLLPVRALNRWLLDLASQRPRAEERPYLELVAQVVEAGSLSERVAAALEPWVAEGDPGFTQRAREVWIELADCLLENRPWNSR